MVVLNCWEASKCRLAVCSKRGNTSYWASIVFAKIQWLKSYTDLNAAKGCSHRRTMSHTIPLTEYWSWVSGQGSSNSFSQGICSQPLSDSINVNQVLDCCCKSRFQIFRIFTLEFRSSNLMISILLKNIFYSSLEDMMIFLERERKREGEEKEHWWITSTCAPTRDQTCDPSMQGMML